mmetsp:Transcript_108760/g.289344  ORF Transcript_108760/g.289344 Transcript_108760/m.289344 type:complete len:256 (+) Transcript_108760:111-878(+)
MLTWPRTDPSSRIPVKFSSIFPSTLPRPGKLGSGRVLSTKVVSPAGMGHGGILSLIACPMYSTAQLFSGVHAGHSTWMGLMRLMYQAAMLPLGAWGLGMSMMILEPAFTSLPILAATLKCILLPNSKRQRLSPHLSCSLQDSAAASSSARAALGADISMSMLEPSSMCVMFLENLTPFGPLPGFCAAACGLPTSSSDKLRSSWSNATVTIPTTASASVTSAASCCKAAAVCSSPAVSSSAAPVQQRRRPMMARLP